LIHDAHANNKQSTNADTAINNLLMWPPGSYGMGSSRPKRGGHSDVPASVQYWLTAGEREGAGLRGTVAPTLLDQPGAGIRLAVKRTVVSSIYSTSHRRADEVTLFARLAIGM
jgi:hypothetical protein